MNQERWDVKVRFLDGPLRYQPDVVMRGPVIRIGSNPGPGGLKLDGYSGIDDRHAVISAYDGARVTIAPVGRNQVRTAEHQHVDWSAVQPIHGPVYLSEGSAVHLGPPNRGATAVYVGCRRLGEWQQQVLVSEAAPPEPDRRLEVRRIDAARRFPWWFIPGMLSIAGVFVTGAALIVFLALQRDVARLGPQYVGTEKPELTEIYDQTLELSRRDDLLLYEGLEQVFRAHVMRPNAVAAEDPTLESDDRRWDRTLVEWSVRAQKNLAVQSSPWAVIDRSRARYVATLTTLRKAGLPDVFAAIPFQESGYRDTPVSPTCAMGLWQFMPETGRRVGLRVERCRIDGMSLPWTPDRDAPVVNAYLKAPYVDGGRCILRGCDVDERTDPDRSTEAAVKLIAEAWNDADLRRSGALVQSAIAAHNAGHDDAKYRDNYVSTTQIGPAFRIHRQRDPQSPASQWFGRNLTCGNRQAWDAAGASESKTCGGLLHRETQLYVPRVLAWHALAVCYYGKNFPSDPAFADYVRFTGSDGYCARMKVLTPDDLRAGRLPR